MRQSISNLISYILFLINMKIVARQLFSLAKLTKAQDF